MARTAYQVNEIFDSIQGEGYWTGMPATFIRLQGCTVGCPWCDSGPVADQVWGRFTNGLTRNTWGKGGERMLLKDILAKVNKQHVVITGGEPTLYDLDPLLEGMDGRYTQIETSGQNDFKGVLKTHWVTWSPKKMLNFDAPDNMKWIVNEVKFVIDAEITYMDVWKTIDWMDRNRSNSFPWIYFMPEGCPPSKETIAKTLNWLRVPVIANGNDYSDRVRFSDRLQYRLGIR